MTHLKPQTIIIELTYGTALKQHIEVVEVPVGTTVGEAIEQSIELKKKFPQMEIDPKQIGIFAKHTSLDTVLEADNRIEIYRPLTIDPKEARKLRAQKKIKTVAK